MPRYDLRCEKCEHFTEDIILTYEEMKQFKCPECGGDTYYVPTNVVINTSESQTFVRIPPERKAAFANMREQKNQMVAERKERNKQRANRRIRDRE